MKYVVDTHTHTIASGHAYSTLYENVKWASEHGIEVLGTTDHGPALRGGPDDIYFCNFKSIPRIMEGVILLNGCEANIINTKGELDLEERFLNRMDIVIASLHDICVEFRDIDSNTEAIINAMDNEVVDIIGHCGNPIFPIHKEEIVKKAKKANKIIEINNGSFKSRPGSKENCAEVAELCKKHGVPVILNTDSHFFTNIGDFTLADEVMKKVDMPEELIMNTDKKKLLSYLKKKGRLLNLDIDLD